MLRVSYLPRLDLARGCRSCRPGGAPAPVGLSRSVSISTPFALRFLLVEHLPAEFAQSLVIEICPCLLVVQHGLGWFVRSTSRWRRFFLFQIRLRFFSG